MDTLREQTNEKMIAVAIKAAETIGVLAEGMGTEFKGCALKCFIVRSDGFSHYSLSLSLSKVRPASGK